MSSPQPSPAAARAAAPLLPAPASRRLLCLLGALLLMLACVLASLAVGSSTVPLSQIWHYLMHPDSSFESYLVNTLRLERTVLGALVGLALAVSGALMQAVTRNPLAEPGLLGVTSGASLAVVAGAALGGLTGVPQQFALAMAGALAATVIVYAAASLGAGARGVASPVRLVLVGLAFSAATSAIIQILVLRSPRVFDSFRHWDVGSLTRTGVPLAAVAAAVAAGALTAAACSRALTAVALGEDMARALGANVVVLRCLSLAALTLLCGTATAVAGPISFVGLMVPLTATWIMGPHRGWILALSALLGPALILAADVVGRLIARPDELQVGLMTAFVGSPVLLLMVLRLREARR